MTSNRPADLLLLMAEGTTSFHREVDALDDEELRQDSLLPGWSRAHVVAHVARNADALRNLVRWARTGEESPMYESSEQRDADIASSAARTLDELLSYSRRSAAELDVDLAELVDDDWQATVRTPHGKVIAATRIPWLRIREVWLHAVDLNGDPAAIDALPSPLIDSLLDEIVPNLGSHPDIIPFCLAPSDRSRRWSTNTDGERVVIEGSAAHLLAWLTGRDKAGTAVRAQGTGLLPNLPAWL